MFRKAMLATTCLVSICGVAAAADMPTKAPAYGAPLYNWTGFYAGVNVGGAWGASSGSNASGVIGGGQIGYNWQAVGSPLVLGLEADIQASGVDGSATVTALGATFTETGKADYFGTVRARLGIAQGRWMGYVTGGWAYTTLKHDGVATGAVVGAYSASNSLSGYAVGGGVEWAAWDRWTVKAEYLYLSFPGHDNIYATVPPVVTSYGRTNINVLRAGLNYRF